MSPEYNNALDNFKLFVGSFNTRYPLADSHNSIEGMIERLNDFGEAVRVANKDSIDKANELIRTIDNHDEQELFKKAIVPILQKGMKDLFEGN